MPIADHVAAAHTLPTTGHAFLFWTFSGSIHEKADYAQAHNSRHRKKCVTGIRGLDEVTRGGLPRGRPALVYGAVHCGKTLLTSSFAVRVTFVGTTNTLAARIARGFAT